MQAIPVAPELGKDTFNSDPNDVGVSKMLGDGGPPTSNNEIPINAAPTNVKNQPSENKIATAPPTKRGIVVDGKSEKDVQVTAGQVPNCPQSHWQVDGTNVQLSAGH